MPSQYRKPMRLVGYDYTNTERACFITLHSKIKQLASDSPLSSAAPFTHAPLAQQAVDALHHYEQNNGLILFALNNPVKAGLVARWEDHPYTHLIQHP
jgi:hypothetical protein